MEHTTLQLEARRGGVGWCGVQPPYTRQPGFEWGRIARAVGAAQGQPWGASAPGSRLWWQSPAPWPELDATRSRLSARGG